MKPIARGNSFKLTKIVFARPRILKLHTYLYEIGHVNKLKKYPTHFLLQSIKKVKCHTKGDYLY